MRVYAKNEKKALPFINYKRIETNANLLGFIDYFIYPRSLVYSGFFKSKGLEEMVQDDSSFKIKLAFSNDPNSNNFVYSPAAIDFVEKYICEKRCYIKHKDKVLMAWITDTLLVYDVEAIQQYLYKYKQCFVFLDKLVEIVENHVKNRNHRGSSYPIAKALDLSPISDDNPELQFLQNLSSI